MPLLPLMMILMADVDVLKPGDHTRSLTVGDLTRTYLVHVPKSYDGKKLTPVVLVFHGGGSNAEQMIRFCGMNDKADKEGFIVVYPQGTGRLEKTLLTFNAGNCCGYAMEKKIDDVAFVRALLDDLEKAAKVDTKRIYATGMSNGGMITYRMASELSDRIAAVAPVAGPMGTETCHPKRSVPVMHFHGTDDKNAPFKGGTGENSLSKTNFHSVDFSIQAWLKANGCKDNPAVVELPDKAKDGTRITIKTYGPGTDAAEVVLVIIDGGGHTWPGMPPRLKILGKSTRNISANDMMWEFFKKHPMK
jgi:polyhydroxybutyrate depolymerase